MRLPRLLTAYLSNGGDLRVQPRPPGVYARNDTSASLPAVTDTQPGCTVNTCSQLTLSVIIIIYY